jgi:ubiquinone/menaquinone biosynthesis C-methylase UbiE
MQRDPEETETKYLHTLADLSNARVIEIGCGDGRLTWRYAASAGRVVGTDPDPSRLTSARRDCPPVLYASLSFAQARAEALPFPPATFDLALLAWSL